MDQPVVSAYWSQPAAKVLADLGGAAGGLSAGEAAERLRRFGPNALQVEKKDTALRLFARQFTSPIVIILLIATGISAVVQDWTDAAIIMAIVLGSAVLSFVQEHSAHAAVEKLRSQVTIKATVLRDGKELSIPAAEVVSGDVVLLAAGSLVPADGLLLEAKDLHVSQSVLTGETFPVERQPGVVAAEASLAERINCAFMGTSVRSGTGRMVVAATGRATVFGQIAHTLSLRAPETEFERGIKHLGYLLSEVMFVLVLAVFAINVFFHRPILEAFLFSLALAVGLTPQLLPAIININLSKGSQVMAKSGVIVRRLAAIENFGSMDILCTDKTGTLTEGVVSMEGAVDPRGEPSEEVFRLAYLNAHFETGLPNPLDEAILKHGDVALEGTVKLDEAPYDFVRKRLSIVVQTGERRLMITKGALDNVVAVCSAVQDGAASAPLDDALRQGIQDRFQTWSGRGFRVLGVATRVLEAKPAYHRDDEHDMVFAGFLLFFDPPKKGVKETIGDLSRLGVGLKIITGDNRLVARHTAEEIGLDVARMVTGSELNQLRDEALWNVVEQANIFAETDPNQKERIVLALKKRGHVVGYMGDGINDAPSLHAADVGISVDDAVDVAKDAADFVLMEKDLGVLKKGIVEGRATFANTMKYVFMATSANFGNMFSMAGASLFLPFLPMLPKQILLINLMTDLPEMTIATDRVDQIMIDRPRRWDIAFIRRFMMVFGLLSSVFDYVTFGLLWLVMRATPELFRSAWFVESVLSATLVVFVLHTRLPFLRSRPSRAMLVVTAIVAATSLALPFSPLNKLLEFRSIPLPAIAAICGIVVAYLASAELTKRWFYRHAARK